MAYRNKEEEKLERREEDARAGKAAQQGQEREKKSWKEVDAQRDGSRTGSRRDEPRPAKRESPAYKNYKSKLDRMFDGQMKARTGAPDVERVSAQHGDSSKMASAAPTGDARVTSNSALNRAAALFGNAPRTESEEASALAPKDQLRQAESPTDIETAARACLAAEGLPRDTELIAKVLSLDTADLQHAALDLLLDLTERGRPKNARALVERMRAIAPTLTDAAAKDICAGLIARFS